MIPNDSNEVLEVYEGIIDILSRIIGAELQKQKEVKADNG